MVEVQGDVNVNRRRKELFRCLSHVLEVAMKKFDSDHASNSERRSWARIIISGSQAYGALLESSQLDELERRLEVLEGAGGAKSER